MGETYLRIDIRDQRLPKEWGQRINVSSRTANRKEKVKREQAVRTLIDRGDVPTLELLRQRKVHVTDIVNAIRDGDFTTIDKLTAHLRSDSLGQAVAAFNTVTKATRKPATAKLYRNWLKNLTDHFGESRNLETVTREEAERWMHAIKPARNKPWAPRTQKHVKILCSKVWKRQGAKNNPWLEVQLPKIRAGRTAFLQPSEWQDLSNAIRKTPEHAMMALGVLAGLREGEVCHLRIDIDVDMQKRKIHIQPREGEFPWEPKHDNSIRSLRIGDELYGILSYHIQHFSGQRYLITLPKQDQPVSESYVIKRTEKSFNAAGLGYGMKGDGLTNHSLRHTFGSWLAGRDVQITKIAKLMGNTVAVCAKHYVHLIPDDLDRAIDVLDEIAKSSATPHDKSPKKGR